MRRKIIGIIICMLLIGTVIPVTGTMIKNKSTTSSISGNTLYVGGSGEGNYSRIQDAINDSVDGDTVFVFNRTYYEYLTIDKSIQLIGEDKDYTIIQSDMSSRHVINCDNKNGITIKGFTLCNGDHGVNFWHSSNDIINDNIIKDCEGPGIFIYGNYDNNNNIISNNLVMNCSSGIHIRSTSDNTISYNIFKSNTIWGMYIASNTKHNTFHNNQIFDNEYYAIEFRNTVENNTFFENTIYGMIGTKFAEVNNNLFYHNNFFGPFKGYGDINNWDNGKEGNYWLQNRGVDKDGDGICDTHYPIKDYDRYPLMQAYGIESNPPDKPILTGPTSGKVRDVLEFSAVTSDPDGDEVRYLFDWGDRLEEEWSIFCDSNEKIEERQYWWKQDTFAISVKARDYYGYESEWSDPIIITIPRSRVTYNSLFQNLLEQFPILHRLLSLLRVNL